MSTETAKADRRYLLLVTALLADPGASVDAIATKLGYNERTIRRRLAEPEFANAFRREVDRRFARETGRLKSMMQKALGALDKALDLGDDRISWATRVRAARVVIAGARDLAVDDILERLQLLEQVSEKGPPPTP